MAELCGWLDVRPAAVRDWVQLGCPYIQAGTRGRSYIFDLADVVNWRLERAGKKGRGGRPANMTEAKNRKEAAAAEKAELEVARLRGEVVPVADVVKIVDDEYSRVRARVLAMPAKLAPTLIGVESIPAAQKLIQAGCYDCLRELSTGDSVSGRASPVDPDVTDAIEGETSPAPGPDGKPMGGRGKAAKSGGKRGARRVGNRTG